MNTNQNRHHRNRAANRLRADDVDTARPVLVTVWPTADPDAPSGEPISSRTAQRLLAIHTRRRESIIDLDNDPYIASEAAATMRRHLPLNGRNDGEVEDEVGRCALVLMRWPRPEPANPTGLAVAAQMMLRPGGHLVAVVDGRCGADYVDVVRPLYDAALAAGLVYIQHILVRHDEPTAGTFTFRISDDDLSTLRHPSPGGPPGLDVATDLLIFWNPGGRHV